MTVGVELPGPLWGKVLARGMGSMTMVLSASARRVLDRQVQHVQKARALQGDDGKRESDWRATFHDLSEPFRQAQNSGVSRLDSTAKHTKNRFSINQAQNSRRRKMSPRNTAQKAAILDVLTETQAPLGIEQILSRGRQAV